MPITRQKTRKNRKKTRKGISRSECISISRKINGGNLKTFTTKGSAFDCSPYQHHFKDIKSPFASSEQSGKDQDNQAWGGTCCNYGKEGRTYIWSKSGGYCTFSTYIDKNELIYDEVKWSN